MNKKRKTLTLSDLPVVPPSIGGRALSPIELSLVIGGLPPNGEGGTSTADGDVDGDGTCTLDDDVD
jgi:hypothetical protein